MAAITHCSILEPEWNVEGIHAGGQLGSGQWSLDILRREESMWMGEHSSISPLQSVRVESSSSSSSLISDMKAEYS